MTTLSDRLAKVPPFLCAMWASCPKHGGMTRRQIASKSGLSLRMVERLSASVVWDGVDVEAASRYAMACGVDLFRPSRMMKYLRGTMQANQPLPWMKDQQREAFNRRFTKWMNLQKISCMSRG